MCNKNIAIPVTQAKFPQDFLSSLSYTTLPLINYSDSEIKSLLTKAADSMGPYAQDYLSFHLSRFIELLKFIPYRNKDSNLLELGAFLPFSYVLATLRVHSHVEIADMPPWCKEKSFEVTISPGSQQNSPQFFTAKVFNVEKDKFPYPEKYFDTVIASEIIEHLTSDPMFMLLEINHILKNDGILIMTTPNVASLRSIISILNAENPIGEHRYSPDGNCYSRHNREYTVKEVSDLVTNAGFCVLHLYTLDVWGYHGALHKYIGLLKNLGVSLSHRGECIFLAAQKKANSVVDRYPEKIYTQKIG